MTRKDYVAIAEVLRSNMERANDAERWRVAVISDELAAVFSRENPRFDVDRFLKAAGAPVLGG